MPLDGILLAHSHPSLVLIPREDPLYDSQIRHVLLVYAYRPLRPLGARCLPFYFRIQIKLPGWRVRLAGKLVKIIIKMADFEQPWVEKYRPNILADIVGNSMAV